MINSYIKEISQINNQLCTSKKYKNKNTLSPTLAEKKEIIKSVGEIKYKSKTKQKNDKTKTGILEKLNSYHYYKTKREDSNK